MLLRSSMRMQGSDREMGTERRELAPEVTSPFTVTREYTPQAQRRRRNKEAEGPPEGRRPKANTTPKASRRGHSAEGAKGNAALRSRQRPAPEGNLRKIHLAHWALRLITSICLLHKVSAL